MARNERMYQTARSSTRTPMVGMKARSPESAARAYAVEQGVKRGESVDVYDSVTGEWLTFNVTRFGVMYCRRGSGFAVAAIIGASCMVWLVIGIVVGSKVTHGYYRDTPVAVRAEQRRVLHRCMADVEVAQRTFDEIAEALGSWEAAHTRREALPSQVEPE